MPEKDFTFWQVLAAAGATLTTTVWVFFGMRKADIEKLEKLDDDVQSIREDIAKNYPSNLAMKACSDAISKSVSDGFRAQTAEMRLVIHEAVDLATDRRDHNRRDD